MASYIINAVRRLEQVCAAERKLVRAARSKGLVDIIAQKTAIFERPLEVPRKRVDNIRKDVFVAVSRTHREIVRARLVNAITRIQLPVPIQIELCLEPTAAAENSMTSRSSQCTDTFTQGYIVDTECASDIRLAREIE